MFVSFIGVGPSALRWLKEEHDGAKKSVAGLASLKVSLVQTKFTSCRAERFFLLADDDLHHSEFMTPLLTWEAL